MYPEHVRSCREESRLDYITAYMEDETGRVPGRHGRAAGRAVPFCLRILEYTR